MWLSEIAYSCKFSLLGVKCMYFCALHLDTRPFSILMYKQTQSHSNISYIWKHNIQLLSRIIQESITLFTVLLAFLYTMYMYELKIINYSSFLCELHYSRKLKFILRFLKYGDYSGSVNSLSQHSSQKKSNKTKIYLTLDVLQQDYGINCLSMVEYLRAINADNFS